MEIEQAGSFNDNPSLDPRCLARVSLTRRKSDLQQER